ncbi:uncharacterized protein STAUR_5238 [Stigmatella aurantiaca DW4/3-1]|uniref:Uncharacterized protein n=1 Tax=Stigmatella aurantiaca (strain DW4/3-1) TaxID=378806 RepID=E3FLB7_STIAD|nr:uncharacterized protein STAUR_5238 [Stigmatella aurantiaca DW4/3-1]
MHPRLGDSREGFPRRVPELTANPGRLGGTPCRHLVRPRSRPGNVNPPGGIQTTVERVLPGNLGSRQRGEQREDKDLTVPEPEACHDGVGP